MIFDTISKLYKKSFPKKVKNLEVFLELTKKNNPPFPLITIKIYRDLIITSSDSGYHTYGLSIYFKNEDSLVTKLNNSEIKQSRITKDASYFNSNDQIYERIHESLLTKATDMYNKITKLYSGKVEIKSSIPQFQLN